MVKRLFVGNLPYSMTEADLSSAFEEFGQVRQATIVTDRESGRSRGFGFVEYADEAVAPIAIQAMNNTSLGGRTIFVNEAHERQSGGGSRPPRDSNQGGGGHTGGYSAGGGGNGNGSGSGSGKSNSGNNRRGKSGGGRNDRGRDRDRRRDDWRD